MPVHFVTQVLMDLLGESLHTRILRSNLRLQHSHFIEPEDAPAGMINPINFVDNGEGDRAPQSLCYRHGEATSFLRPGDTDWQSVLNTSRIDWLHFGGIVAGLNPGVQSHLDDAVAASLVADKPVGRSYDLNFRESVHGPGQAGLSRAKRINRRFVSKTDFLFGGIGDFERVLLRGSAPNRSAPIDMEEGRKILQRAKKEFSELTCIVATFRIVHDANQHELGALCLYDGEFVEVPYTMIRVTDRVGSGDAFVAGFLFAALSGKSIEEAMRIGWACADLACTTSGDLLQCTSLQILNLATGKGAGIRR